MSRRCDSLELPARKVHEDRDCVCRIPCRRRIITRISNKGDNPLILLHSALSEGLHAQTDEQCLELAQAVRVVLAELAERIGQALKDEAELNAAISRLMKR
jgi:hypothetical protein